MSAITLNFDSVIKLTDEQFFELCQKNDLFRFERNADGKIIIMTPSEGETSKRNANLNFQLVLWNQQTGLGEVFDSNGGFKLPNGAIRAPDVSWVEKSRWQAISPKQREKFLPLCPDFVIELLSPPPLSSLVGGTQRGSKIKRKSIKKMAVVWVG